MLDQPLSDAEFNELSDFLHAETRPAAIMDIAMLDGFLTALLLAPNTVLPSRWLPMVWGETTEQPMEFDSDTQMRHILELVMRHYNQRARDLAAGVDLYDPVVYTREHEGRELSVIDEWCTGFMRGVVLDAEAWDPLFQSEDDTALLTPMILYGTESGLAQLEDNPALKARQQEIADALGVCVIGIRDYWLEKRKATATYRRPTEKAGRNDPCPCGSGVKYKKCCGSPGRLH
jgi:uncharacterized protein